MILPNIQIQDINDTPNIQIQDINDTPNIQDHSLFWLGIHDTPKQTNTRPLTLLAWNSKSEEE